MSDCPSIYIGLFLHHFSLIKVPFLIPSHCSESQSDVCSFTQPTGWIHIPLRHSREPQKVTIFQETIIITLSLPQDERCHYMPAESTLSESAIHSCHVRLFQRCVNQRAPFPTVGTDAFKAFTSRLRQTHGHTLKMLSFTLQCHCGEIIIHNVSHIQLSWTPNKAALWQ